MRADCLGRLKWRHRRQVVRLGIICMLVALLAPAALAAPVRLAKYDFVVSGQEAATGDFAIPAGRNRTVVITVHARTDTGPTADYVTVDWARLDGAAGTPLTKARQVFRSVAPMHQSTTLLYRHIDNSVSGDHNVLIRMGNNLTEAKIVHVHIMGNLDPGFDPAVSDSNQGAAIGTQAFVALAADADYVVIDAATHNAGPAATITGRAPAAKVWMQVDNAVPSIKALAGYHVKVVSNSVNYTYTASLADNWSMLTVRFRAAYTIEASAGPNGAIDPVGDVPVLSGGGQAFNIDADTNYVIAQLLVDGAPVEAAAGEESYTYTFSNVTADHTIDATFSGRPILTIDPATEDFECIISGYTETMAMDGVSAIDPEDGDITGSVVMSNVVFPLTAPGVYTILYDVSDSDATPAVQQQRVVTIADTLPPDLALVGDDVVFVQCGGTYEELGAEAVDQCDGELLVDITGDTVDEMSPATYSIHYAAIDTAGLPSTLTRTVIVEDTVGPEITILSDNPLILDNGDPYNEPSATAWDACEGAILASEIVVDSSAVNDFVIGTYEVTYTVEDSLGNETVEVLEVIVQREICALIPIVEVTEVSALPNEEATLEITFDPASCAVGTVEFEWKKKQADDSFLTVLSAPNAPAYVIASATEEDSGIYRCDVSDAMYTVSSAEISLNVGTGVPAAGLAGLALAAAFTALAGAVAIRKERR